MAVDLRAFSGTTNLNSIGLPTGTAAGDLLICRIAGNHPDTYNGLIAPAGWTQFLADYQQSMFVRVWWKIADASEPVSYNFDPNNSAAGSRMAYTISLTGADASSPFAASVLALDSDYSPYSSVPLTTTRPGNYLLYAWSGNSGAGDWGLPPSGLTAHHSVQASTSGNQALAGTTQAAPDTSPIYSWPHTQNLQHVWVMSLAIQVPNLAPNAPTLTAPADNAVISSGSPATFSWTHSDPEGDAQGGYAFRRRVGTGAYEWWNAGTAAWVTSEHVNTSSTQSTTFPTGRWVDGTTYNWSVATRDPDGLLGTYSTQRNVSVQNSATLGFTGAAQTYIVPANVTQVLVECWGAEGGNTDSGPGGDGGYVKGTLAVTPGETLNVYVGGTGGDVVGISNMANTVGAGGFNGGASGGVGEGNPVSGGAGGGGASDVRQGGTALADRKAVAGGGGGAGGAAYLSSGGGGGHGGYAAGGGGARGGIQGGAVQGGYGGGGGTQTGGGAKGAEGNGNAGTAGPGTLGAGGVGDPATYGDGWKRGGGAGGGGGYYGGGGGGNGSGNSTYGAQGGGGGAGSSYVGGLTATQTSTGVRTGDGQVVITAIGAPVLSAPANNLPLNLTQSNTTFSWTSSTTQAKYALYRRPWGSAIKEWWNGTTWQSTEYWVATATQSVSIPSVNWSSDDATFLWTVAIEDTGGTVTPYASEFTINPWEMWDGIGWVPTEQEIWIVETNDAVQIDQGLFVSGQYRYAIRTRDAANQESPYAEAGFTFGGAVLREGWGQTFI